MIWRIGISIIALFAIRFVPLFGHNYLGGGYGTYVLNPLFWGHLNFDGEHYLAIAQNGYQPLEYFFFPLFPIIMSHFSVFNGLIISNLFFFVALLGFYKLIRLDFDTHIAKVAIILLLVFPTSFYFASYYTESIFLALIVWSFLFARQSRFFLASLIALFASATRLVGGIMFVVLASEFLNQRKSIKEFLPILISPLGILAYMYYLLKQTHDPLIFLHQVAIFGQQRSSTFILLPQVIYRYVFEILPYLTYSYFPVVFTTYLEFICGVVVFLLLIIYGFFKLRISYSIYALLAYLIPTLAGSFSSMPRYVLIIFPIFILVAIYLNKAPKIYTYIIFSVMILLLIVSTALFWRGYWIS